MNFNIEISALINTEYALDNKQLEQRLIDAISAVLKSDCTIEDMHVNVTLDK